MIRHRPDCVAQTIFSLLSIRCLCMSKYLAVQITCILANILFSEESVNCLSEFAYQQFHAI